jgi:nucleoporin NUP159
LDTINRTFRNIDLAIEYQVSELDTLAERMSKLDIDSLSDSPARKPRNLQVAERDSPEPAQRPREVTPDVAKATAAALNAEAAAHRLKTALLRVRREPLLNTQAVSTQAAPHAFKPSKPEPGEAAGPSGSFFAAPFSLPPFPSETATSTLTTVHRRGSNRSSHSKPIPLKREGSETPSPKPPAVASFNWGPLPGVKPATSLAADLRAPLTPPK